MAVEQLRATVGLEPSGFLATDRLLGFLGENREEARRRYRAFVGAEPSRNPFAQLGSVPILGSRAFVLAHTAHVPPTAEIPRRQRQPHRPALPELLGAGDLDEAISLAYRSHGYTMREIAEHLGVHYATVSRRIGLHEQRLSHCKT